MKHTSLALVLASLLLAGLAPSVPAATLFSDGFDSYTAGQALPVGASPNLWADPTGSGSTPFSTVTQDTGNLFHTGSNNAMTLTGNGTNTTTAYLAAINSVGSSGFGTIGQVSFSFDQTATFSGGSNDGIILRLGSGIGNTATAFAIALVNGNLYNATGLSVGVTGGSLATYSLNTVNTVTVVFNNSASSYAYGGGTLQSAHADIYFNGALVGTEGDLLSSTSTQVVATGANISNFNFTTKASFTGTMLIDDVTGMNAVAVPEPGTTALLLLGALGAAPLLRRRPRAA